MPKRQYSIPVTDLVKPERSLTPAKVRTAVDVPERGQRIYWLDGVGRLWGGRPGARKTPPSWSVGDGMASTQLVLVRQFFDEAMVMFFPRAPYPC